MNLDKYKEKMHGVIDNLEKNLNNIRAGRANPHILDGISIPCYGTLTPINQIANISVPEARQLSIKPYDKSLLKDIEKAIFEKDIGLTPNNNGECIFLIIPALTGEKRKEMAKDVKQVGENTKIALRTIRQDAINFIKREDFSEDEEKRLDKEVQDMINNFNKIIDDKVKSKEEEIMTI